MFFVCIQVPRQGQARVVGCVVLRWRQGPGTDEFSAALALRQKRPRRTLIFASRGTLDNLTASVAKTGHVQPRLTTNTDLAVLTVDHLRRPGLPVS